jgi:hypothetical protein
MHDLIYNALVISYEDTMMFVTVTRMGAKRTACRIFLGKPEGKRPLGRHGCRW